MMSVLDSFVGMKLGIVEQDSDLAEALVSDYAAGTHELLAPDLYPAEIANGLLTAERRGLISDSPAKFADVMADAPVLHPFHPLVGRAFEIARAARIAFYDCVYVALAEQEGCDFVTADQRLINALQAQFPFIKHLRDV